MKSRKKVEKRNNRIAKHQGGASERQIERLIMGRNSVTELWRSNPERIERLYVAENLPASGWRGAELIGALSAAAVPVLRLSVKALSELLHSESHQGVAAAVRPLVVGPWQDWLETQRAQTQSLILILDELQDPHNLGAVLRAGECFGVDAVFRSRNRGVQGGGVVSKSSAGASELLTCFEVGNLVETVKRLKAADYWIVAAESGAAATALSDFEFPGRCALVLGAEGSGIKPLLLKQCDYQVAIPMLGQIDSLNVSQAAAVFLHAYRARLSSPVKTG